MTGGGSSPGRAHPPRSLFGKTFRALAGRDYRLWYAGQGVSLIGTFLQQTALSWYLYRTTGSTLVLGAAGFASQIPTLVATPIAGVVADRIRRKRGLLATQSIMMLQAAATALLVLSGRADARTIVVLTAFLGLAMAFDIPIRQAYMSDVVSDPDHLPNAIALNSALFNAARLVGPALAGVAVGAFGEGACLVANAASFAAVLAALLAIRAEGIPPPNRRASLGGDFIEGLAQAWRSPVARPVLALVAATSLTGLATLPLVPAIARESMRGGAHTLGFLMGSLGAGALAAALGLASRAEMRTFPARAGAATLLAGSCVAVTGFPVPHALLYVCFFGAGYGFIHVSSGSNALLQSVVPAHLRGRVVSLFAIAFLGTSPFGSLALGWLAESAGLDTAMRVAGLACAASGAIFLAGSRRVSAAIGSDPGSRS